MQKHTLKVKKDRYISHVKRNKVQMGKILSGERVHYIDVARGIAIILMVLGHILEVETIGRELVFSFHMPLFLIVSGYFFSDKGSFGKLLSKLLVKLLLPAFVILTLVNFINMFIAGPDVSLNGSPTVSPTTAAL